MGKLNWQEFQKKVEEQEARTQGSGVRFFGLKNDGDKAIVRFMHNSPDDFDLVAVHGVKVDNKFRNISCLRNPSDPIDMCPLCAAKMRLSLTCYIHMIVYERDDQGKIVPTPMIWERSASYAKKLANLIQEYGPLSESIFTITRNGAARSVNTTYDIMYGSPKVYTDEMYPAVPNAFADYTSVGHACLGKTYQELNEMLAKGSITSNEEQSAPVQPAAAPVYTPQATYNPQAQAPVAAPAQPAYNAAPVQDAQPAFNPQPNYGTQPVEAPAPVAEAPVRTYREPTAPEAPVAPVADYGNRPVYGQTQGAAPAPAQGGDVARPRRVY